MRLALHPTTEVGHRAGRILLAEAALEALGIYGHRSRATEDRRSTAVTDLSGYTVLASDDATAPFDLARIALDDGLSCVLAAADAPDPGLASSFAERRLSLLTGASLPGLAEALAAHEVARADAVAALLVAWTIPGKPQRRGEAIPFPDPVGARWGSRLPERAGEAPPTERFAVPVEGPWAAALARVTTGGRRRQTRRLVGVADDRRHLEAIALAAGALVVAEGGAPPGACRPGEVAAAYLGIALRLGLEVAGLDLEG